MTEIQITLYVANDGTRFEAESECLEHEQREAIIKYLDEEIYWRETCAEEIVRKLQIAYNITPK